MPKRKKRPSQRRNGLAAAAAPSPRSRKRAKPLPVVWISRISTRCAPPPATHLASLDLAPDGTVAAPTAVQNACALLASNALFTVGLDPELRLWIALAGPAPTAVTLPLRVARALRWILVRASSEDGSMSDDAFTRAVYAAARPSPDAPPLPQSAWPSRLLLALRPYQARAVQWMIDREAFPGVEADHHPLWVPVPGSAAAHAVHWNLLTGELAVGALPAAPPLPRGGLLADEMGLGKTIEVLTLLLARDVATVGEPAALWSPILTAAGLTCSCRASTNGDLEVELACPGCGFTGCPVCCGTPLFFSDNWPLCAACHTEYEAMHAAALRLKATLIVTPTAIAHQWADELAAHASGLRVMFYHGTQPGSWTAPSTLVDYDVIITTFAVLAAEIHHVSVGAYASRLRRAQRYVPLDSPLAYIHWWRIISDESQMIEGASAAAAMVAALPTTHRWAVTGTPVTGGLGDIAGLLRVLHAEPYTTLAAAKAAFGSGSPAARARLERAFGMIAWRNTKDAVAAELALPPLTEIRHEIPFSAVEAHSYRVLANDMSRDVMTLLSRTGVQPDDPLPPGLQSALHRLRMACCHPELGGLTGAFRAPATGISRGSLTMSQVLEHLITRATVEAVEAQRLMFMSRNGLAGALLLTDPPSWAEAADTYRETLQRAHNARASIDTDSLQILHARAHLLHVLDEAPPGIVNPDTALAIEPNLRSAVQSMTDNFVARPIADVAAARSTLLDATDVVVEAMRKLGGFDRVGLAWSSPWWANPVAYLDTHPAARSAFIHAFVGEHGAVSNLANRTRLVRYLYNVASDPLPDASSSTTSTAGAGTPVPAEPQDPTWSLMYVMTQAVDELFGARAGVLSSASARDRPLTDADVDELFACPRCDPTLLADADADATVNALPSRALASVSSCTWCRAESDIKTYEAVLLYGESQMRGSESAARARRSEAYRKQLREQGLSHELRGGSRSAATTTSRINTGVALVCESLARFFGLHQAYGFDTQGVATAMRALFAGLKKELITLRSFWRMQVDELLRRDELRMTMLRLRKALPGESVPPSMQHFVISPAAVHETIAHFRREIVEHNAAFARAKAQLHYLQRLRHVRESDLADEACPICHDPLAGDAGRGEVVVFYCGHMMCRSCADILVAGVRGHTVPCPTCRARMNVSEITYVSASGQGASAAGASAGLGTNIRTFVGGSVFSPVPTARPAVWDLARAPSAPLVRSWSSKLDVVVRQAIELLAADPSTKILVFSEWSKLLGVLAQGLAAQHVLHTQLGGKSVGSFHKVVNEFKTSDASVLLLPLRYAANGINLTQASVVFLLEPNLDPGVEAQAVGRVHRIGQTRPTTVFRFVVSGSVETAVARVSAQRLAHLTSSSSVPQARGRAAAKASAITVRDAYTMFGPRPVGADAGSDTDELSLRLEDLQAQARWWRVLVLVPPSTAATTHAAATRTATRTEALRILDHRAAYAELQAQVTATTNADTIADTNEPQRPQRLPLLGRTDVRSSVIVALVALVPAATPAPTTSSTNANLTPTIARLLDSQVQAATAANDARQ